MGVNGWLFLSNPPIRVCVFFFGGGVIASVIFKMKYFLSAFFVDTNILDWNCNNYLAVSLRQTIYIWSAEKGTCRRIRVNFSEYERAFLTALCWNRNGKFLAVGTNGGEVLVSIVSVSNILRTFSKFT